jgi:solute carrier family 44 protein 1 (choline transporter-like protein)
MFLIFFRFPGSMTAVLIVCSVLSILLIAFLGALVWDESDRLYNLINDDDDGVSMDNSDDNVNSEGYQTVAIAIVAIGVIVLIAIIILMCNVKRTFEILRLSARPLKNIPLLLLIPMFELFLGAALLGGMLAACMATVTVGNYDTISYDGNFPGGEVKMIHYHENTRWLLIFIIPVFLWWLSFIATSGEFIVNSAAAVWFFSKEKSSLESPISKGISNLFKYHLGSILLGSIVVPMFRIPKAVLGWCKGRVYN